MSRWRFFGGNNDAWLRPGVYLVCIIFIEKALGSHLKLGIITSLNKH
jgi:hypothetical protein